MWNYCEVSIVKCETMVRLLWNSYFEMWKYCCEAILVRCEIVVRCEIIAILLSDDCFEMRNYFCEIIIGKWNFIFPHHGSSALRIWTSPVFAAQNILYMLFFAAVVNRCCKGWCHVVLSAHCSQQKGLLGVYGEPLFSQQPVHEPAFDPFQYWPQFRQLLDFFGVNFFYRCWFCIVLLRPNFGSKITSSGAQRRAR